jgi:trimeric autotransporter adhesin
MRRSAEKRRSREQGTTVLVVSIILISTFAAGQDAILPPKADAYVISGQVKSGTTPLPGVSIVIGDASGRKIVTSTDAEGLFSASLPAAGRWMLRGDLAAFAPFSKEVIVDPSLSLARIDIQLVLQSRASAAPQQAPQQPRRTIAANGMRGRFQQLEVNAGLSASDLPAEASSTPASAMPGVNTDLASESVAISGAMGSSQDYARNFDDLRNRMQDMQSQGQLPNGMGPGQGPGQGQFGPGVGGMGGGMGAPGGFGGGGGGFGGGGRGGIGRFNSNSYHGSLFYSAGTSALNAAPYALSSYAADEGQSPEGYGSSRFGGVFGGPFKIPKLFDDGGKTFFYLSAFETLSTTPYDVYSTVPAVAERQGIFPTFQIPESQISPQAQYLLNYIPLPNSSGPQNYHFSSTPETDTTVIGMRLTHNFGTQQRGSRGSGRRQRNNINFSFNYSASKAGVPQAFPDSGGTTQTKGIAATAGETYSRGRWNNQLRFSFNQSNVDTTNQFTGVENVSGLAGIQGISPTPGDWGLPTLSFGNYSSLTEVDPLSRRDRVYMITDTAIRTFSKHTLRFGGDFRRMYTRIHNNTNPNGTFVFTGIVTGDPFGDFLLGLPQQTSIQYSPYTFDFAANAYDGFVQDQWRARSNLTFELGLRYEYVSPYTEAQNRIVNLDANSSFTAVAPVQPGQVGPYSGLVYPNGLIKPDRTNFGPRIGLAWRVRDKLVVRTGYGINYNNGQYKLMVQQMAEQYPFAFTQTNQAATSPTTLTLANGFPTTSNVITNNYGVDPNYRLGYVQMWNLNIQYELTPTLLLNVGYTGTKGTDLDVLEAPNRAPNGGLLIPGVQAFLWETSAATSIMNAGTIRIRKRMTHGMSVGGTYIYSKSIDDASSIGGGAVVVQQIPGDLAAERGLSSFNMTNQLTGDFLCELPFGTGKRWLDRGGAMAQAFGDWNWSGTFTIDSGTPWTARVLNDAFNVSQGVNGTLRANYNGQPIQLSNPTIGEWFNTAAFSIPPFGTYGTAGRSTIIGPGWVNFNMSLNKNFPIREMMSLELRVTASNVFNTPHFTAIDTVVNSPTFGRVTSVGAMRQLLFQARYRF